MEVKELKDRIFFPKGEMRRYDTKLSYSSLSVFESCPFQYDLRYNQHLAPENTDTLALNLGSLCHKILEIKADAIMSGTEVDYDSLRDTLVNGWDENVEERGGRIPGINDIKKKYGFEEWFAPEENGNYEEKVKRFIDTVVPKTVPDNTDPDGWKTIGAEVHFEFMYKLTLSDGTTKNVLFHGFVDRIDEREGKNGKEYRCVDYKTSKKPYDEKKLVTPLQMIIYGMFIYLKYGSLPVEYLYDFILLDEKRKGCSLGYLKRGLKKIDKLLTSYFESQKTGEWVWKPTPLCYWCNYSANSMMHDALVGDKCKHYCLWTPTEKRFDTVDSETLDKPSVNTNPAPNSPAQYANDVSGKRKLIF